MDQGPKDQNIHSTMPEIVNLRKKAFRKRFQKWSVFETYYFKKTEAKVVR